MQFHTCHYYKDGECCPAYQINSFGKCCQEGHQNSDGLCCPESHHNSDGICCYEGFHNSYGICCLEGQHNSDGICCSEGFVNLNGICSYSGDTDNFLKIWACIKSFNSKINHLNSVWEMWHTVSNICFRYQKNATSLILVSQYITQS